MVKGKVKRWLIHKGFGFIECVDYNEDIYANINEVKDRVHYLLKGQRVKFEVKDTDRGLEAVEVEIIPEWA